MPNDNVKDDDYYVHGFCLGCGRKMADSWMENNAFVQEGMPASCPTCGDVIAIMDERNAKSAIESAKAKRGI